MHGWGRTDDAPDLVRADCRQRVLEKPRRRRVILSGPLAHVLDLLQEQQNQREAVE
jgi:hypothetical protein